MGRSRPTKDETLGISINLYQDNTSKYATTLSNLIHPSITGSSTITFGLNGNLDTIRPSNGSSRAYFDNLGITMAAPMRVMYGLFTDDSSVGGFITGTGKTRLLAEVDKNMPTFSYPRSKVYNTYELDLKYYTITGTSVMASNVVFDYTVTGYTQIYDKPFFVLMVSQGHVFIS